MAGFSAAVPVIGTEDVEKTVSWFEQTLGFERQWIWGEPPVYAGIKAGDAELYVCEDAPLAEAIRERDLGPDVFLWVTGIGKLYQQHRENGVKIIEDLTERPWGKQYVVREPNGYKLKIAEASE